jgi:hypothetical protein
MPKNNPFADASEILSKMFSDISRTLVIFTTYTFYFEERSKMNEAWEFVSEIPFFKGKESSKASSSSLTCYVCCKSPDGINKFFNKTEIDVKFFSNGKVILYEEGAKYEFIVKKNNYYTYLSDEYLIISMTIPVYQI